MKIVNISECGSNNTLLWVMRHGTNLCEDEAMSVIINNELAYTITIDDVNFYELFRLTQTYRDRLRIVEYKIANIPERSELVELFPGDFQVDDNKKAPLLEVAEHASTMSMNLALQMNLDSDVIKPGISKLFLPMISRRFTIQIPVSFYEVIKSFKDNEEYSKVFNDNYPNTLNTEIVNSEFSSVKNMIYLSIVRSMSAIKYDKKYVKYVNAIIYSNLDKIENNNLYKFYLKGFMKYNPVTKADVFCNLFASNKESLIKDMKKLSGIRNDLKLKFVIELPINHMQILLNTFNNDELEVIYQSSTEDILNSEVIYKDFISHEYDIEDQNEEIQNKIKEYENRISLYENRIKESIDTTIAAFYIIMNNDESTLESSLSLLPSIYKSRAEITINMKDRDKYINIYDATISSMFKDIFKIVDSVENDINNSK